jgi:hypothetical protein
LIGGDAETSTARKSVSDWLTELAASAKEIVASSGPFVVGGFGAVAQPASASAKLTDKIDRVIAIAAYHPGIIVALKQEGQLMSRFRLKLSFKIA